LRPSIYHRPPPHKNILERGCASAFCARPASGAHASGPLPRDPWQTYSQTCVSAPGAAQILTSTLSTTVVSMASCWYLGARLRDGGWNHAATRCCHGCLDASLEGSDRQHPPRRPRIRGGPMRRSRRIVALPSSRPALPSPGIRPKWKSGCKSWNTGYWPGSGTTPSSRSRGSRHPSSRSCLA
jgi:hypothetical protein